MNRSSNWCALALVAIICFNVRAATLPSDWQHEQAFNVSTSGLIKISLPVETLDAARPALEDLRLYDDSSSEVPYVIERLMPSVKTIRDVKSFQVSLQSRATVITIETGLVQPLDTITLETPALSFLKPVRIEASADGRNWQTLAQGQPIFRQLNGAGKLSVSFPSGAWAWLRLTADDQRTAPIPFTGARVQATVIETAPTEWMLVTISERTENPGESRLALNLGAANLNVASVKIETTEPLFTRHATFAVPQVSEDAIREQTIGQGAIYKVAVEGQPASENLSVPLDAQIPSRELLVLIKNEDSPPLAISSVRIERRPVYLVFLARQSGTFHLLTGNSHCAAPRYDLAALGMNLKSVAVTPMQLPPPAPNPNYRAPEVLAGIEADGAALDVSDWKFRKPVKFARGGAQQIELDLEVLSRAQSGFSDLRLVREGKQIPYVLEHTSITRAITPLVTVTADSKRKNVSRWIVKLPQPSLPIIGLQCVSSTALFDRQISAYEEGTDERGEHSRSTLGSASWNHKPGETRREFSFDFLRPMDSDTFILETDNGDNPPIELDNFRVFYRAERVLFKAKSDDEVFLYYGNPNNVAPPRYDLSLVAGQLLTADKSPASLGAQEQLKKSSWAESHKAGTGGLVFWGVLALVVIGLLAVISRLLPKDKAI
jgi:hypothetical protein